MSRITDREEARQRLEALNRAIALAVLLCKSEEAVLRQWLEERRDFDTLAPILDPTLYRDPEKRQVAELLDPVYRAVAALLDAHAAAADKIAVGSEALTRAMAFGAAGIRAAGNG